MKDELCPGEAFVKTGVVLPKSLLAMEADEIPSFCFNNIKLK